MYINDHRMYYQTGLYFASTTIDEVFGCTLSKHSILPSKRKVFIQGQCYATNAQNSQDSDYGAEVLPTVDAHYLTRDHSLIEELLYQGISGLHKLIISPLVIFLPKCRV